MVEFLIRVNYFPNGGMAKLKISGEPEGKFMSTPPLVHMLVATGDVCKVMAHSTKSAPSVHEDI